MLTKTISCLNPTQSKRSRSPDANVESVMARYSEKVGICHSTQPKPKKALKEKLLQVIVLTRHGARYPTASFPHDLNWPSNEQFWSSFDGSLTPLGCRQLHQVGSELREYYSIFDGYLSDLSKGGGKTSGKSVCAFTSNTRRTLLSAQSLLEGLLPNAAISIRSDCDESMRPIAHDNIIIHVEDQSQSLFFTHGQAEQYLHQKRGIFSQSTLLKNYASDRQVCKLLKKLWVMTR